MINIDFIVTLKLTKTWTRILRINTVKVGIRVNKII